MIDMYTVPRFGATLMAADPSRPIAPTPTSPAPTPSPKPDNPTPNPAPPAQPNPRTSP